MAIQKKSYTCSQCGSPLKQTSEVIDQPTGLLYPQTNSTYICTNEECQNAKDVQTASRIKLRDERKLAMEKRAGDKLRQKMGA